MKKSPRILFLGTPNVAIPFLEKCATNFLVVGVITAPNAPSGRGKKLTPPPLKTAAEKLNLPIFQPKKASDPSFLNQIKKLKPDITVVVAYGEILSKDFLSLASNGSINVHFSLLPRWRGASPVQHAILAGDSKTGVTIQKIVPELDAGPILAQAEIPISTKETSKNLFPKLTDLGTDLLIKVLQNDFKPKQQDHTAATFCKKISKSAGEIDFKNQTAIEIDRRRRAFDPWPGIYTTWQSERLKILDTLPNTKQNPSGKVELFEKKLLVGTASGSLEILKIQKPGKGPVSATAFLNGHPNFLNAVLPN